uniref:Uncharacterized protein n=1 Tax=Cacopsylla melanoneura TaxID=428564 RepID=A0A8D8LKL5_9HEMI
MLIIFLRTPERYNLEIIFFFFLRNFNDLCKISNQNVRYRFVYYFLSRDTYLLRYRICMHIRIHPIHAVDVLFLLILFVLPCCRFLLMMMIDQNIIVGTLLFL